MNKVFNLFEDLILYLREQEETDVPEDDESVISDEEMPEDDQSLEGMDTGEEQLDAESELPGDTPEERLDNLGKIYKLKKIYARLLSVSKHLDKFNGNGAEELKKKILESIDIFHLVVNNFDEFVDKIDDIIKLFEKLLNESVNELERLSKSWD